MGLRPIPIDPYSLNFLYNWTEEPFYEDIESPILLIVSSTIFNKWEPNSISVPVLISIGCRIWMKVPEVLPLSLIKKVLSLKMISAWLREISLSVMIMSFPAFLPILAPSLGT